MRISDGSSDVCSSDLDAGGADVEGEDQARAMLGVLGGDRLQQLGKGVLGIIVQRPQADRRDANLVERPGVETPPRQPDLLLGRESVPGEHGRNPPMATPAAVLLDVTLFLEPPGAVATPSPNAVGAAREEASG